MGCRLLILVLGFLIAGPYVAIAWAAPVRVEETSITIPTYLLGPQDPNPPFQLVNSRKVYPYTMLDDLTNRREAKQYRAIVLENAYLRATILPGVGGRLYSLYDKPAHREVFYRNHVIKYGLIGLRGAWISGGIEFNFPNGHTTDTVSPVSSYYRTNPDGSATAYVGDVDQVSGMYWQVALTLRPGAARLEQRVTLFNPTPVQKLYWYWDNAAAAATEDLHYIYPMREVNPDEPGEYWNYPAWKGTDYSQYKNIRTPTEIFGVDIHRDFYGAYYTQSDHGLVHYANYRDMIGKKIWTWGVSDKGLIWTDLLTDHDGPYSEVQAGRFASQLNQEWMPPQNVDAWTEYWYPVQKLGDGFVEANKQLALNVRFLAGAQQGGTVLVSVSPTEAVQDTSIHVSLDGKSVQTIRGVSFAPLQTQSFSVPVADLASARKRIAVEILDDAGHRVLSWSADAPIDGNRDFKSRVGMSLPAPVPASELTVQGVFLRAMAREKSGDVKEAQLLFAEALQRDPEYVPALHQMAVEQYRAADFSAAQKYAARAVAQNEADPSSQYLAGILDRAQGKFFAAKDAFWVAVRHGRMVPQALLQLGEIALAEKEYAHAEQLLRQALQQNPADVRAQSDLAVALRHEGKQQEAEKIAAGASQAMPLYPLALAEQWQLTAAQPAAAQAAAARWKMAVGQREQGYLEAAAWYREIQDWPAADFILQAAVRHFPANQVSAMMYYYLAADAIREGQEQSARQYIAQAQAARYEFVFVNRLEDVAVLQSVLQFHPADAHAQYLLGNFLFQYGRYAEAQQLWQKAKASGFAYAVLDRNLALDAWKVRKNPAQAADLYQQAIRLAPEDFRLYIDLDEVYAQMGDLQARSALFAQAPAAVLEHDPARIRYVLLLLEKNEPEKALAWMQNHSFRPWEQGVNVHDIYAYACVQAGRNQLSAGKVTAAEASFRQSQEYPRNLGVGRPDDPVDAAGLYWLGAALQQQKDAEGAKRVWNELLQQHDGPQTVQFYRALALRQLGETAQADARLRRLQEEPARTRMSARGKAESYYVAGLAARQQGKLEQAREDFHQALQLDASVWQAQVELSSQP
jgi:tetratricopeptide (TPR) repeat protein